MDKPKCETCPYFAPIPEFDGGDYPQGFRGYCVRYPPQVYPSRENEAEAEYHDQLRPDCSAEWPIVLRIQWCGEHPDALAYVKSIREAPASD